MKVETIVAAFVGAIQLLIGFLAMSSAYLIYYDPNSLMIGAILNISPDNVALFILLFSIIGFFSAVSGLLIVYEWVFS
jgi:hypothetical protein